MQVKQEEKGMVGKHHARTEGGGVGVEEHVLVVQVGEEDQHLWRVCMCVCVNGWLVKRRCLCLLFNPTTGEGRDASTPLTIYHGMHTHIRAFSRYPSSSSSVSFSPPLAISRLQKAALCMCVCGVWGGSQYCLGQADKQIVRRASRREYCCDNM